MLAQKSYVQMTPTLIVGDHKVEGVPREGQLARLVAIAGRDSSASADVQLPTTRPRVGSVAAAVASRGDPALGAAGQLPGAR